MKNYLPENQNAEVYRTLGPSKSPLKQAENAIIGQKLFQSRHRTPYDETVVDNDMIPIEFKILDYKDPYVARIRYLKEHHHFDFGGNLFFEVMIAEHEAYEEKLREMWNRLGQKYRADDNALAYLRMDRQGDAATFLKGFSHEVNFVRSRSDEEPFFYFPDSDNSEPSPK